MNICRKCNSKIPSTITIKGKRRDLRKRRYCFSCSPFKKHNRKILEIHGPNGEKKCPMCKNFKLPDQFYQNKKCKKLHSYCKECSSIESRIRQLRFKKQCVDYKGGKCTKCGDDSLIILDFHHLNPELKEFTISRLKFYKFDLNNKKLITELDKCILLCANCHRKEHAKRYFKLQEIYSEFGIQ